MYQQIFPITENHFSHETSIRHVVGWRHSWLNARPNFWQLSSLSFSSGGKIFWHAFFEAQSGGNFKCKSPEMWNKIYFDVTVSIWASLETVWRWSKHWSFLGAMKISPESFNAICCWGKLGEMSWTHKYVSAREHSREFGQWGLTSLVPVAINWLDIEDLTLALLHLTLSQKLVQKNSASND